MDTDKSMVVIRQKGGQREAENGKRGQIYGDGRFDFGW